MKPSPILINFAAHVHYATKHDTTETWYENREVIDQDNREMCWQLLGTSINPSDSEIREALKREGASKELIEAWIDYKQNPRVFPKLKSLVTPLAKLDPEYRV